MKDIGKLLYITEEIKSVLRQVSLNQGRNVFVSIGEAEVVLYYPMIQTCCFTQKSKL